MFLAEIDKYAYRYVPSVAINKKTVSVLGDEFFNIINSVKSKSELMGYVNPFKSGDKVSLTGNNVLKKSVGLPGWVGSLANIVFGVSKATLDMNMFSPSSFRLSRKHGGRIFAAGDKVSSSFPTDRIPMLDLGPTKLGYDLAARYGLLRRAKGGPVKKYGIGDLLEKAASVVYRPPTFEANAGLRGSGSYMDYGFNWENGGYLENGLGSSRFSNTNHGFGIVSTMTSTSSLNASLLRELIEVVKQKELSVDVVDENGNSKDDSSFVIRRRSQLEYRNTSELV